MKALYYARRDRRAKNANSVNCGSLVSMQRLASMAQLTAVSSLVWLKAGVEVNRKMLADLAVNDAAAFAKLVEVAKNA